MEDIKILEDLINRLRNGISLGVVNEWNPNKTFAQAIENLINRNKELEKQVDLEYVEENYIEKSKVIPKSKVEEIRDKAEVMDYYTLPDVIEDLNKLLEE